MGESRTQPARVPRWGWDRCVHQDSSIVCVRNEQRCCFSLLPFHFQSIQLNSPQHLCDSVCAHAQPGEKDLGLVESLSVHWPSESRCLDRPHCCFLTLFYRPVSRLRQLRFVTEALVRVNPPSGLCLVTQIDMLKIQWKQ